MKGIWVKLRTLVSMKNRLIEALRADLESALCMNDELQEANNVLSREVIRLRDELKETDWWRPMDRDMEQQEFEERSDEIHIDYIPTRHKDTDDVPF